jgi:hypothetical protein
MRPSASSSSTVARAELLPRPQHDRAREREWLAVGDDSVRERVAAPHPVEPQAAERAVTLECGVGVRKRCRNRPSSPDRHG